MAIPIIFGAIAAATGALGVGKGIKGALDTKEASDVQERAEKLIKNEQAWMKYAKDKANSAIKELGKTKLQSSANEINDFVNIYSQIKSVELQESVGLDEMRRINMSSSSLKEMKNTALGAIDVLGGGIAGVGAGVLLGWGTYGGVMALGTASTGAAIGGLSGVAATNATLAWLGGGAIAAGGGGMALGTVVLGGIIAGPALLVAGGIFGAKAKEKLHNAYSNLSEAQRIVSELKTAEATLDIITDNAKQLNDIIHKIRKIVSTANCEMKNVVDNNTNWKEYSKIDKNTIIAAMKSVQILKKLIDMPLLTEDGMLTEDIKNIYQNRELLELIDNK